MNSRRNNIHKRKRKKRVRWVSVFLILLIATTGYAGYQYYQGLKHSGKEKDKIEEIEFNGEKDENGKVNVLLLGVDSRNEEKSRTDTIMIAQYDPNNHQAKLVSLMRDMYVEIPGYQNYKINTAYFLGGPELLRQTIKQNFGIDIQYYALIDFNGFVKVVDTLAPNGIEMNVEKRMSEKIGVVLEPGIQNLDGKELLGYARFRQDAEGDFGRVRRQQEVIDALKNELISISGVAKLPKLFGTIQPYVDTNMGKLDSIAIAKDLLLNPVKSIESLRLPINDSYSDGYYDHAGSVLEIDFEKNREALDTFLNKMPDEQENAVNAEQ